MSRHRRRVAHARSEDQRTEISERLQVAAMEAIQSSPEAFHTFLSRNHRRRRRDQVQRLLQKLTGEKQ